MIGVMVHGGGSLAEADAEFGDEVGFAEGWSVRGLCRKGCRWVSVRAPVDLGCCDVFDGETIG